MIWQYDDVADAIDIAMSYWFNRIDAKEPLAVEHTRWAALQEWVSGILLEAGWTQDRFDAEVDRRCLT